MFPNLLIASKRFAIFSSLASRFSFASVDSQPTMLMMAGTVNSNQAALPDIVTSEVFKQ
jgi:hypothetical protein